MIGFVVVFVQTLCLGLPVYWGAMMLASVCGYYHPVGANGFKFLVWTVVAASAIVFVSARRWVWTQVAFAVLTLGMMRLLIAGNAYSLYAVLVWCVGLLLMAFEQKRQKRRVSQPPMRPAQASVQQSGSPAPETQHGQTDYSYSHLVQRARYNFSDIVGMAHTKKRLLAAAKEILASRDGYTGKALGKSPNRSRNGMLLFGEPGNGKTLFAEALAGELNVAFLMVSYADVASKWVNETPQKIRAVFEQARRMPGCVLFFDEFDSLIKARDSGQTHSMDRDNVNVVLSEIVALRGTSVVLVAASNFIDSSLVDQAAIREGRFDYKIEVPPPDFEARKAILGKSIYTALGRGSVDAETVASLAQRWEGFSASRLDSLGGQLREMRDEGVSGRGRVTFDVAMQAMRLLQGRKGKLPEGVKPISEIIMPAQSRDALRDLAFRMKNVFNLEKIGGRIPTGLVFAGPPGTGKTQAAMSLAKESGYAFLATTGAQIIAQPDSWDRLVREARDIRPTVVLLDEGEDLSRDRRHSAVAALTNKILTTLDGAEGRVRDVVYILATNHYDQIDPALARGGRFEETIMFDVPVEEDMTQYVRTRLKQLAGRNYVIMPGTRGRLNVLLTGQSIADADAVLQKTIDAAAVRALRESVSEIRAADVDLAVASVFACRNARQ